MAEPDKPQLPSDVESALQRGDFIGAIKLLRGATGIGLQDARSAIDRMRRRAPVAGGAVGSSRTMQQGLEHGSQPRPAAAMHQASFTSQALPPLVVDAIHGGRTIEAIRLMREHSGLGLKESKDAVDRYAEQHRAAFGPLSPGEMPRSGMRVWMVVVAVALLWLAWRWLRFR